MRRSVPILLFLAAAAHAAPERPLKATLTVAEGDVKVSTAAAAPWEPAEAGMALAADARIKTGADGSADILFEDGTALRVEKDASVAIQSAKETGGWREYWVRLWSGRLLSQVAKKSGPVKYKVQTPVAVAAVRGTEFVADASEKDTSLAVFEGQVETQSLDDKEQNLGQAVTLGADQELGVDRGRPAGPPRAISEAMSGYRAGAAALFRARMDRWRGDMGRVRRLQKDFMERRRRRNQDAMDRFRRERRRKARRQP
jgi:hypothetical protein